MTLDDLRSDYNRGFWSVSEADGLQAQQNAGIRAVVKALRDEIEEIGFQEEMPFDPVIDFLNEILASREGGQAAGEATRADNSAPLPAAPAPDVCEWKMNAKGWWVSSCDTRYSFRKTARQKLTNCQLCNAPISFKTEAQR